MPRYPGAGCAPVEKVALVLVVAPHPQWPRCALVPARRRPIEHPVVAHRDLEAPGGGHIGPIRLSVRERVDAHSRAFRDVPRHIRATHLRVLLDRRWDVALEERAKLLLRVQEACVPMEVRAHS